MNFKQVERWIVIIIVIATLIAASCGTGILIGRGQQQFIHFTRMRAVVESTIASDPEFQTVTCYESSSCHLYVEGTLTEAQQKRFIETVLHHLGEIESVHFTFNFKSPAK